MWVFLWEKNKLPKVNHKFLLRLWFFSLYLSFVLLVPRSEALTLYRFGG